MYLPTQFASTDRAHALALMRDHPFASLISVDQAGAPLVTHLPLVAEERGSELVLLGHVARANPHVGYLADGATALATFLGPHAYLSPKVYPDERRVPTWNYLAVHCRVEVAVLHEPESKDALLKKLIGQHEPEYAAQWRGLGEDFARVMLGAIVAFELRVTDLQCKLKLNQHRPEAHAAMRAAYEADGTESGRALAGWMDRLGIGEKQADVQPNDS